MSFRSLKAAEMLLADRRTFLLSGASLAVLPWLGQLAVGAVKSRISFSDFPFQLGVASGDPAADGFVIWTRLAPQPLEGGGMPAQAVEVDWQVATDQNMQNIVRQGTALATPQLAHSVHVELHGLEPDRWYFYRFTAGDAESPVGRARTTPSLSAMPDKLRLAFASCQHWESGLYTAYEHMVKEDLDLILHLGDYIYENAGKDNALGRKHVGPEIVTLDHYRNRHAQYKTDKQLQAAHELCPWLVVWDDHEVDNNYANDTSEHADVSRDDLLVRRANAYQAYYEHMPLRKASLPKGIDMQLFRGVAYGRLADLAMLDTRQYRSDQANGDGRKPLAPGALDPNRTMLGNRQERWLMNRQLASGALWNVLGQQVMMARVDVSPGPEQLYGMDIWSGYDAPRKRLLGFLAERKIPNPVVLTGDIHSNWVNDLKVDFDKAEDPIVATEFVGTSISSGGNGSQGDEDPRTSAFLSENPFVKFHNRERGYVSCTITPTSWQCDYQVVEFIDKPGAPLVTRRSFVVEAGQPGAKNA